MQNIKTKIFPWIFRIAVLAISFLILLYSCNKASNELKPYSKTEKFTKSITYKGSTVLLVEVEQKIQIGADSLILIIQNTTSDTIQDWDLLFYVQNSDSYDGTLDYSYPFELNDFPPLASKRISILNHPDLPLNKDEIKIALIRKNSTTNLLSGVYTNGTVGFYFGNDTLPTAMSYVKGIVQADGKFEFWMELGGLNKKLYGQFIDTTTQYSLYNASEEITNIGTTIERQTSGFNFDIDSEIIFTLLLNGQPATSENKLKFMLTK